MITSALRSALARLFSLKRLWFLYYLSGLVFAAVVALPAAWIVNSYAGRTLAAERLSGFMDVTFLIELFRYRGSALSALFPLLMMTTFFFSLVMLFFSGGALKLMAGDHPYRPREFWDACSRYFGRFVLLFVCSLPLLALLFLLPALADLVRRLFWGKDPGDNITYWFGVIKMGLRYLALLLWALFFDYSRILAVQKREKRTHRLALAALRFANRHFGRLFILALLLTVISLLGLLVYNPVADLLHAPSAMTIAVLFLWQQLYMFFRAGLRLFSHSSQMKLSQALARDY
ncbi:MAG TPA: hypothetical protein PK843_17575 [bacterium]|nr:hypothetical protein [bacterium]HPN36319.1 hypothetical protein [bacterium]